MNKDVRNATVFLVAYRKDDSLPTMIEEVEELHAKLIKGEENASK